MLGDGDSPTLSLDENGTPHHRLLFPGSAPCALAVSVMDFYPALGASNPAEAFMAPRRRRREGLQAIEGAGTDSTSSSHREALCISGRWIVGALSTDLLGVVTRTTGYVRDGLADGLACCFRAVDGSIQVLVPPFVPGHEQYPTAKPGDSIADLGAELLPGAEVAFQVVDDGACVTFSVTVLDGGDGGTGNAVRAFGSTVCAVRRGAPLRAWPHCPHAADGGHVG